MEYAISPTYRAEKNITACMFITQSKKYKHYTSPFELILSKTTNTELNKKAN